MSRNKYLKATQILLRIVLENLDLINIEEFNTEMKKKIQKFNLRNEVKILQSFNRRNSQ